MEDTPLYVRPGLTTRRNVHRRLEKGPPGLRRASLYLHEARSGGSAAADVARERRPTTSGIVTNPTKQFLE